MISIGVIFEADKAGIRLAITLEAKAMKKPCI
jgi:hypothetical protein